MGNSEELIRELKSIGQEAGERCWDLPLWEDYSQDLKRDFADAQNATSTGAGALIGGSFLRQFVNPESHWVHMDIAGTAISSEAGPYTPKGATGVGVRLLGRWLMQLNTNCNSAS